MNLLSYLPQLPQAWDQHGTSTWTVSCIDVEPILLGPGGNVDAIANLLAQHGHSELKDLTMTDLRLQSLVEMSRDLRSNQECCFQSKETYREHTP